MRAFLFLALGVAILAGLFVALRPHGPASPAAGEAAPSPAEPSPSASPEPASTPVPPPREEGESAARTFDLVVAGGKLVSGPATIVLTQGDLVVLRVRSDLDDELHLHGYDLTLALRTNKTGSLAFQADRSGRFEFELHHGGVEIGALEVQPR